MAILGFLAMLAFGAYLTVAGVALSRVSMGFAGRISVGGFVLFVIGLAVIFFAIVYAPFTVSIN